MEELRSSEVLDREILEDARKKALKIMKTAEENIRTQALKWEVKTGKALNRIRLTYVNRTREERSEILAKGPLDRRRLRIEISEQFLKKAMNDFLGSLQREDLFFILRRELRVRLGVSKEFFSSGADAAKNDCETSGIRIDFRGINEEEARSLISKTISEILPDSSLPVQAVYNLLNDPRYSHFNFPVMIINTPGVRITASVDNAAAELLENSRAELTAALLGTETLND